MKNQSSAERHCVYRPSGYMMETENGHVSAWPADDGSKHPEAGKEYVCYEKKRLTKAKRAQKGHGMRKGEKYVQAEAVDGDCQPRF